MTPTAHELASALLAVFEGPVKLKAYQDSGGKWTAGRGHTLGVTISTTCTPEEAAQWFLEDQAALFDLVAGKPPLAQAALISFGFNCGRANLRAVLAGTDTIMGSEHQTDKTGRTLPGLTSRRTLEYLLTQIE